MAENDGEAGEREFHRGVSEGEDCLELRYDCQDYNYDLPFLVGLFLHILSSHKWHLTVVLFSENSSNTDLALQRSPRSLRCITHKSSIHACTNILLLS